MPAYLLNICIGDVSYSSFAPARVPYRLLWFCGVFFVMLVIYRSRNRVHEPPESLLDKDETVHHTKLLHLLPNPVRSGELLQR